MRILLLNQYYPPDPAPTGVYLHDLAGFLLRRGHKVSVICSSQSYNGTDRFPRRQTLDGILVKRLAATGFGRATFAGKIADYATFYISLLTALMFTRERPDVIISLTTPPYLGLLGKLAAWRHGCPHAHWIMDLYPDVIAAHRMARGQGVVYRLLQDLTRFQLRGAQAVVALGPIMAERMASYVGKEGVASLASMPLWSDPGLNACNREESALWRAKRGWPRQDTVFLYAGNMGLGHRFTEFLEAARCLGTAGPRWVYSGGGKKRAEIQAFGASNPSARIELRDYVPRSALQAHLCAADVHIASLDSKWQGLIVPSKLQASFAVGRPVLFVGGRQSETAAWITESGGGWVVEENSVDDLLDAIRQAMDPAERHRRGEAALAFARERFQMSTNCARLAELIEGRGAPTALDASMEVVAAAATK
jgi:glycosyltransferase involved in cell wall biosynthesis